MAGDLSYTHEKFSSGVRILATGHGRIRERLIDAWISQIGRGADLMDGTGPPVPDDLARQIIDLQERMTCVAAKGDEGTVTATVNAMSEDEAAELAGQVCSLDYHIEGALREARGGVAY